MPVPSPLEPGDPARLGPYELLGRLGSGGQGVVFLGRDASGERVAIKVLHQLDKEAKQRLAREVVAAQRVARFCTAQTIRAELDAARPYIVSEFVDGPSLQTAVTTEGPRKGTSLDRLAVATATALAAIHRAGVVHRDFKPHNVLLGPDGPCVIDFGIARSLDAASTLTQGVIGTPAYMAPEQIGGGDVRPATDVFAWGAVMVFAATGRPPFWHDRVPALFNAILTGEPDLSGLTGQLRDVVAACLAKEPGRRPSAHAVLTHLIGYGDGSVERVFEMGTRIATEQVPLPARTPAWSPPDSPPTMSAQLPHPAPPPGPPPGPMPGPSPGMAPTWPPATSRRPRWPLVVLPIAPVVVLALVSGLVWLMRSGSAGTAYADRIPDTCKIYDGKDGKGILAAMGAAKGKRIPMGEEHSYGSWSLCGFGTFRFPPKNTFQIQLNVYKASSRVQAVDGAASALRKDMGCQTYLKGNEETGWTPSWQEACEGIQHDWVTIVARRGNVIAMSSCSASSVSDADRSTLRHAASIALSQVPWT